MIYYVGERRRLEAAALKGLFNLMLMRDISGFRRLCLAFALMVLIASLPLGAAAEGASSTQKPSKTPKPSPTPIQDGYDKTRPEQLNDEQLRGKSCILIDADSGEVLYEKDADTKREPASTTKMMTLLLALEQGNLNKTVTVPKAADKVPSDSTRVPVHAGEKIKMIDLLYGLMIKSGNDACVAVASAVSGSGKNFVQAMNDRAAELGCTSTRFANVHGYANENHYTTARDLALIAREGMKNETFRAIVGALKYKIPKNNKRKKAMTVRTKYELLIENSEYYYPYATGIKTGFHSKAGYCFVGSATKDGVNLISVTLKSTESGQWQDTIRLMDYGFETLAIRAEQQAALEAEQQAAAERQDPYLSPDAGETPYDFDAAQPTEPAIPASAPVTRESSGSGALLPIGLVACAAGAGAVFYLRRPKPRGRR